MSYLIKKQIAHRKNYGDKRKKKDIKYIVIHYTANDGDHDEGNAHYFKHNIVKASAHYFVDDDSITQSVPDNYIAWAVGGKKYNNTSITGGGKFYGKCTNSNSISIELCDTIRDGKIEFTAATVKQAVELTKNLMDLYGISKKNVIRHFDVTGKVCPKPFVEHKEEWENFKKKISNPYYKTTKKLPLRMGASVRKKTMIKIPNGKKVRVLERTNQRYWKIKTTLNGTVYKGNCNKRYLN